MSDTSQLAAALAPAIAEAFQAIASRPVRTHYSIVEAAEALGVSIDTIRGAIDRGVLKSVKVGKEHRINVEQLRKLGA